MLSLPKDILSEIFSSLCIVDRVALEWTCKKFLEIKPTNIRNRTFFDILRQRIGEDLDIKQDITAQSTISNPNSLFFLMCKSLNVVISGSFILDCLYDTNFHNNINLYRRDTKSTHFADYMSLLCKGIPTEKNFSLSHVQTKYVIRATRKRVILLDVVADPEKVISHYADIDLTKARYRNSKLKVCSWEKLIERKDCTRIISVERRPSFDEKSELDLRVSRMEKYIERGFDITHHPKEQETQNYLNTKDTTDSILEMVTKDQVDFTQFDT